MQLNAEYKNMKRSNLAVVLIIIAIVAIFLAIFIVKIKNRDSQKPISQSVQQSGTKGSPVNVPPTTQKESENVIPEIKVGEEYYKREIKEGYATGWKLVFVNGGIDDIDDECAAHIYEGETKIGGWYTYEEMFSGKYWFFNILYFFNEKGKKISNTKNVPKVRLVDAPKEIEDKLKKSSKNNPMELTIRGLYGHCEGAAVSIEQGRRAFAKEIETGVWQRN